MGDIFSYCKENQDDDVEITENPLAMNNTNDQLNSSVNISTESHKKPKKVQFTDNLNIRYFKTKRNNSDDINELNIPLFNPIKSPHKKKYT